MEESYRGAFQDIMPALTWRKLGTSRKLSGKIARYRGRNITGHLPNAVQKHLSLHRLVQQIHYLYLKIRMYFNAYINYCYRVRKFPPPISVLSQINSVHAPIPFTEDKF